MTTCDRCKRKESERKISSCELQFSGRYQGIGSFDLCPECEKQIALDVKAMLEKLRDTKGGMRC